MKNLVIVESPNKAKTIQGYLGDDWIVKSSFGHIRDLPSKEMGVDLVSFKPEYVNNSKSRKTISELKSICKKVKNVYLATDPDREGEAIAWHLEQVLNLKNPKRITYNEVNKKAVQNATNSPTTIDYKLVFAQEGRRVLDRLVGYSVTPAISNIYGQWITAGRVQSPAVLIVVERELEIKAFRSKPYAEVFLLFENNNIKWNAKWLPGDLLPEGVKYWTDIDFAKRVSETKNVIIVSIENKKQSRRPPSPFITSTMQQAASVALHMSPSECMKVAQELFEGANAAHGFITYHRTDSPNISDEGFNAIISWLNANNHSDDVVDNKNTWKAKGSAQEGHEAIRPTTIDQTPDSLKSQLSDDQFKLYKLIWQRAVASQMKNAIFDVSIVKLKSSLQLDDRDINFISRGQRTIYLGWMKLTDKDATDESDSINDQPLPALEKNSVLTAISGEVKKKKTKPPPRYTEASLVKKLEDEGIGRPATYAPILKNILTRGYVSIKKRKLVAEDLGITIYELLNGRFKFMELGYTKEIERQLDEISVGDSKYFDVVNNAYSILQTELKSLDGMKITNNNVHQCPKCEKPLRLIKNKFWGCTGYMEGCDYTASNESGKPGVVSSKSEKTIDKSYPCACGKGYMQKRPNRGKPFWGCSDYPECKTTLPDKNGEPGAQTSSVKNSNDGAGEACPDCSTGALIIRTVKNGKNEGKTFYGCTSFPKCKHFAWASSNG